MQPDLVRQSQAWINAEGEQREDAVSEITWDEYCAKRNNEGLPPHRNAMGVDTFNVRVLTIADVARLIRKK